MKWSHFSTVIRVTINATSKKTRVKKMKKIFAISLVSSVLLLSACGNDNEEFEVLFFTEELNALIDDEERGSLEQLIADRIPDIHEDQFNVTFHVAIPEKFFVEIAAHQGDLIFVDEGLIPAVINAEGLHSLNEVTSAQLDENLSEPYRQLNPDTEEEEIYALPINNDTVLIQELGVEINDTIAGFIPLYTNKEELAKEVIEYLANQGE